VALTSQNGWSTSMTGQGTPVLTTADAERLHVAVLQVLGEVAPAAVTDMSDVERALHGRDHVPRVWPTSALQEFIPS
jgi:hypothetical protein